MASVRRMPAQIGVPVPHEALGLERIVHHFTGGGGDLLQPPQAHPRHHDGKRQDDGKAQRKAFANIHIA
jgi:hypothetical protein